MNFGRSDEQRAIAETARELLAARGSAEGLWTEVRELGWPGIAVAEAYGGQGLGLLELSILVEELGYACSPTPLLGTTLAALAIEDSGSDEQRERLLPDLAAGRSAGALAVIDTPELVPDAAADRLAVLCHRELGTGALHTAGAIADVEAIDPARAHGVVVQSPDGGEPLPGDIAPCLDRAAIVVAAELVGLCRRALDLTLAYVKDRRQFGVPVGSFQAVGHTAAAMLRATESAAVATSRAAWVADNEPADLVAAAAMAKASASSAGREVTAAAIQMHGGIGFTWEADLHWLFKRAQVDAAYLGGSGFHQTRLARATASELATRRRKNGIA
jgi:alkylation response protein AidB-like acyl-CoA dehydrogenase